MSVGEVLAAFAALMTVVGVPVGILFRQHVKTTDDLLTELRANHARELAERDRRIEAMQITESRLIEVALRSTLAGERAADTAVTALRGSKA